MHPYPTTSSYPPTHPPNSPSRQAQEVQEGKADPGAQRDRGYLLDRNHLRNMPYFKPVHVSRLSRCPVQGARRGQSGSRGVRTLALTLARAPPAQPRWACVCTRPGEAGPARPPPPSPSSSGAWAQRRTLSLLHALLTRELGSSCHAKLGKFVPTCNSGDATHGGRSLLRVSDPITLSGSLVTGPGGLPSLIPFLSPGFWLETNKLLSHRLYEDLSVPTVEDVGGEKGRDDRVCGAWRWEVGRERGEPCVEYNSLWDLAFKGQATGLPSE